MISEGWKAAILLRAVQRTGHRSERDTDSARRLTHRTISSPVHYAHCLSLRTCFPPCSEGHPVRPPILFYLRQRGSTEHPRFLIADQAGKCFDGGGFGPESRGLLFADFSEAAFASQRLLAEAYGTKKHVTRYVAPIQITVHSDDPLDIEAVQLWASRVAQLILATPTHGNGPVEDSLGLVQIDWSEMRQVD